MPQYLFIFTIGPVQSFIAQARKAQDLWAGSQLLSELITKAIGQAKTTSTAFDYIFPYEMPTSKPNRFVAKIEVDNIKTFGDNLKVWVKGELLRVAKCSFKNQTFYDLSEAQLSDFLEVYWAAVLYDESNYNVNYGLLERTLGAVKNYRAYNQFSEQGRKCSMNGFYNALFYKRSGSDTDSKTSLQGRKFLDKKGLVLPDDEQLVISKLQKGEGLCGVSFLKRFYKATDSFPSVANIALMHLWQKETIKNSPELLQMLCCDGVVLIDKINEFNAQLLYSENINEEYWKEQDVKKCTVSCAEENLRRLTTLVKQHNLKFNKYYAVLVFDADNMGSHLSKCTSIAQHQGLSKRLSEYADWATNYIDTEGYGKTIYAGGDDFMGMLNLNMLFQTVKTLREKFEEYTEGLTFSAGIAIAHYKTPLGEVLGYARKMEKKAKEQEDKNAFAIAVLKHSGEIHETVLPWFKKSDKTLWFTELLREINEDLKDDISPKFINALSEELSIWEDNKAGEFRPMANYEIDRLIKRAKKISRNEDLENLQKNVKSIYLEVSSKEDSTNHFINAINVADFINRKI